MLPLERIEWVGGWVGGVGVLRSLRDLFLFFVCLFLCMICRFVVRREESLGG